MNPASLSLVSDLIRRLIWRIAIPTSTGTVFNTLFNGVDTSCTVRLATDSLAALSVSFPLFFLLIAVGSRLGQGSTALLANALGSRNESEAGGIEHHHREKGMNARLAGGGISS